MTAKELIEKLKEYPPDALVVKEGFRNEFHEIKDLDPAQLEKEKDELYYPNTYYWTQEDDPQAIKSVILTT